MNAKILGFLALTLAVPVCAYAQVTTLEFQSGVVSGTTSTYTGPQVTFATTQQQYNAGFTTTPLVGDITAMLTLNRSTSSLNGSIDAMGQDFDVLRSTPEDRRCLVFTAALIPELLT